VEDDERNHHNQPQPMNARKELLNHVYSQMAVFEASCLLVTLQCGISPSCKDLRRHVAALTELLYLAGKIPQSESPGHKSAVTQEIQEDLRVIKEIARRQMARLPRPPKTPANPTIRGARQHPNTQLTKTNE
jgi:hypothetical protein